MALEHYKLVNSGCPYSFPQRTKILRSIEEVPGFQAGPDDEILCVVMPASPVPVNKIKHIPVGRNCTI